MDDHRCIAFHALAPGAAESYRTFARVLAVYVRDKRVLTLEEAVRKMSSFPAMRIDLTDRGVLRPG